MNEAREALLKVAVNASDNEETALLRGSSTRFHVSPSGNVRDTSVNREDRGRSEPPNNNALLSINKSEHKVSTVSGRFRVVGSDLEAVLMQNNGNFDEFYVSRPPSPHTSPVVEESSSPIPLSSSDGTKSVHFCVGDNTILSDSSRHSELSSERDHNTYQNIKSWRNMQTIEHPPIIDFYRNTIDQNGLLNSRPSMNQLIHGEKRDETILGIEEFKVHTEEIFEGQLEAPMKDGKDSKNGNDSKFEKFNPPVPAARTKFGWFQGVFVRCILNIFGVMLYLRVSWVTGQAGIGLGSVIVLLASLVTFITALSTCAICTNGDVKGGGAYFLISRSLGPEFGGSIGLIFSVANAVGAAMYVVGFAETVRDLLKEHGMSIVDGGMNDVRIVGIVSCLILMAIIFIGTAFESKMQMGLLIILAASIVDYFIGSVLPISEQQNLRGFTGYSFSTLTENFLPSFRDGEDFFSVFAVYFPAATGIMAGANISGDLADPQRAIPIGTLLAIGITTVIYLGVVWTTGSLCVRDASGIEPPLFFNGSFVRPDCYQNFTCPYGLMNYFQVMETASLWGPLITAGIFAATLSSALASLVSAPKVFQAVCKDRLFPKIGVFAKGYGKNEEPRRAYFLALVIALLMILIGELNAIAPIISNFFLMSYALINYSCFDASFADSPGFRPGFKYYNMWVSLAGAVLCVSVMFIISWSTALLTFFFFAMLFMYLLHRKPDVNWGSSTQAHSYKSALTSMQKLMNTEEHVKNYRPQLLVLTGNPAARPSLVDFVYSIAKGSSLMICGYVVPYPPSDRVYSIIRQLDNQLQQWLKKRHVKAFYVSVANPSLRSGVQNLLQISGLGKLRPNILIIGFKSNWNSNGPAGLDSINDYFGIIQDAFENRMGVCVLRNAGSGLDFSELMKRHNVGDTDRLNLPDINQPSSSSDPNISDTEQHYPSGHVVPPDEQQKPRTNGVVRNDVTTVIVRDETSEPKKAENDSTDVEVGKEREDSYISNCPLDTFEDDESTTGDAGKEEKQVAEAIGDEAGKTDANAPRRLSAYEHLSLIRRRRRKMKKRPSDDQMGIRRRTAAQRELVAAISRFQRKIKGAVIDVWWLYDDGGLTLLLPHLLTLPRSYLEGGRMRIFTISTSRTTMEQEQRSMAALLSKFRIDFSVVSVIPDIGKKPKPSTIKDFEKMISPFRANDGDAAVGLITDSELGAQKEKTNRQLRLSELLHEHSCEADLIALTLPVPRKGLVTSCLYMAWLDIMTRDLPPTLMIRGNQTSVLTFYS